MAKCNIPDLDYQTQSASFIRQINISDLITNNNRRVLLFAGSLLCLVSLILTIKLTLTMADDLFDQALMAALGAGIELCKWVFVSLGFGLLFRFKSLQALPFLGVGITVILVSIIASVGFWVAQEDMVSQNAMHSSTKYQAFVGLLEGKKLQIDALQKQANQDSQSRYPIVRERTKQNIQAIQVLQQEQYLILEKMEKLSGEEKSTTTPLFQGLAKMFKKSPEQIKFNVYVLLSILLEICGMMAIALARLNKSQNYTRTYLKKDTMPLSISKHKACAQMSTKNLRAVANTKNCAEMSMNNRANVSAKILKNPEHKNQRKAQIQTRIKAQGIPDTGTEQGKDTRYKKARNLIGEGDLEPSFRSLKNYFQIGNETARRYLAKLQEEGIIYRKGRGYVANLNVS